MALTHLHFNQHDLLASAAFLESLTFDPRGFLCGLPAKSSISWRVLRPVGHKLASQRSSCCKTYASLCTCPIHPATQRASWLVHFYPVSEWAINALGVVSMGFLLSALRPDGWPQTWGF